MRHLRNDFIKLKWIETTYIALHWPMPWHMATLKGHIQTVIIFRKEEKFMEFWGCVDDAAVADSLLIYLHLLLTLTVCCTWDRLRWHVLVATTLKIYIWAAIVAAAGQKKIVRWELRLLICWNVSISAFESSFASSFLALYCSEIGYTYLIPMLINWYSSFGRSMKFSQWIYFCCNQPSPYG